MRTQNLRASQTDKPAQRLSLKTVPAKLRVLIADDDRAVARGLAGYMVAHGFEARVVSTVADAKEAIEFWQPHTVFVDLMLPVSNALSLLRFINGKSLKLKPEVVVMSRQASPDGIAQARKAGAAHYLIKPISNEDAFHAVMANRLHDLPSATQAGTAEHPETSSAPVNNNMLTELHLLNLILKQAAQPGTSRHRHYNLMRMISMKTRALRCSLVYCMNEETGEVAASNDDEAIHGLPLDLGHYPEIREVRRVLRPVVIPDVRASEIMAPVQGRMARTPYQMIALFPVYSGGRFWGVLSLRATQKNPVERFYIEKFGEVCAQILSLSMVS